MAYYAQKIFLWPIMLKIKISGTVALDVDTVDGTVKLGHNRQVSYVMRQ